MDIKIKNKVRNSYMAKRNDGFTIFLDGDKELDRIRKTGTREEVIQAVAMKRAQQIARNYARKYAPDIAHKFEF